MDMYTIRMQLIYVIVLDDMHIVPYGNIYSRYHHHRHYGMHLSIHIRLRKS
jgi:hypothetical protein